jgi:maltose/maltodextrin transport system substrate-binding protein
MSRRLLIFFLLCAIAVLTGCARSAASSPDEPIRPGVPGVRPFWNENARQFIWPPAFDFKSVPGAARYRFTAVAEDGREFLFDAREPWAPLTSIWNDLPLGQVRLQVEARDAAGSAIGVAGSREFHRAAPFAGPYGEPVLSYARSADVAIDGLIHEPFMQAWLTTGKPDPRYRLYRYSAKLIAAVMSAGPMYARQMPRPHDADDAIAISRRAADYLISISTAPGTRLENFPPTYHNIAPEDRENENQTMLISGAEAGGGYLDLFDATGDRKYSDAAVHIADTYARLQRADGTWPLKVDNRTAESVAEIDLIPSAVITFLDRLITQYRLSRYQPARDRAIRWVMREPGLTFNWQAQFDDAKLRGAYQNLSKHEACEFAAYLFRHADGDVKKIALAEEVVRFAEDQFVIWEHPPAVKARFENMQPRYWITPCSAEQYAMFEPISGSSAFMIVAYLAAYRATDKPLYLDKARSLANALTVAQQQHHGRYPTRMVREDLLYWLNSTVNTARAMRMLAEVDARAGAPVR